MSYVHYIIRGGKAKLCILKLTSVINHFPSVSAFVCNSTSRIYALSAYFLAILLFNQRNPKEY